MTLLGLVDMKVYDNYLALPHECTQVSIADFVHRNKQWVRRGLWVTVCPPLTYIVMCNVYNYNVQRNSGFQRASDVLFS